jgi:hypothetical protein
MDLHGEDRLRIGFDGTAGHPMHFDRVHEGMDARTHFHRAAGIEVLAQQLPEGSGIACVAIEAVRLRRFAFAIEDVENVQHSLPLGKDVRQERCNERDDLQCRCTRQQRAAESDQQAEEPDYEPEIA